MDRHEKNIQTLLGKFQNKDHKKEVIDYWEIRKIIDKVNTSTQRGDITALYHLSRFLKNKAYEKATQDDMMAWEQWLKNDYSDGSVLLLETKVRRFYKYLFHKDEYKKGKSKQKLLEYPDNVGWITTTSNNGEELPIDSILNEEQIKQLLDSCRDIRDQVIIVSLLDGGLRVSELRALKIKNVDFEKQLGAYFLLPKKAKGLKTGMRRIQLFLIPSSTNYIKEYLNHHKNKNDPDSYFIYSIDNSMKREDIGKSPLTYTGIWTIVERIVKNSGIKQNIHPHVLRHCSATYCAMKGFNEAMMRERFGWSRSSTMPSHYTHLASKDTSDYIKKLLGIKEDVTPEDSILQSILCSNCEYSNVPTNVVCGRCGMKLSITKEDLGVDATITGITTQEMLKKEPGFQEFYNDFLADMWMKYKQMKDKEK